MLVVYLFVICAIVYTNFVYPSIIKIKPYHDTTTKITVNNYIMDITPDEALRLYTFDKDIELEIERIKQELENSGLKDYHQTRQIKNRLEEPQPRPLLQVSTQIVKKLIMDEDAAKKIFDVVCKSIEDEAFSLSIFNKMKDVGENALILATFDVHYIDINCLPEHHPGRYLEQFMDTGRKIANQINNCRISFFHRIRSGKFEGWWVTPYYHDRGIFVDGSTHFRIEKIPLF